MCQKEELDFNYVNAETQRRLPKHNAYMHACHRLDLEYIIK